MESPVTCSTKLQALQDLFELTLEDICETQESSFPKSHWLVLLPAKRLLCEAQVHSRKLLKKSFDQSFEAGKRRQEALKKQDTYASVEDDVWHEDAWKIDMRMLEKALDISWSKQM